MKGLFIGLTTIDILYPLDHFPLENEKARATSDRMDIGGPAMNAAYAFAALGGSATLITWVGQHTLTDFIHQKMREYEINLVDLNSQQERDPVISAILINQNSGSRTIVTSQVEMNIDIQSPEIDLEAFDILCVDGFFGDYLLEIISCNNRRIPVVFDGGSHKAHTDRILPWVHYPILSGHFKTPLGNTVHAYLSDFAIEQYAVTNGENPIQYFDRNRMGAIRPPSTNAIDTLAAGDIFHGAFSKYILEENGNFPLALKRAADIASLSCNYIGARDWSSQI